METGVRNAMLDDGLMFSEYGRGCSKINDIVDSLDIDDVDFDVLYTAVLTPLTSAEQVTVELVEEALGELE